MANTVEIMELYTAYFNRAADKAGVDYWAKEMNENGWTLDQVAQSFADQPEYQAIYGNLGNEETIVEIYKNLLNREPDAAGLAYWEEQLDSGAIQISNMVQAIINGAQGSDIAIIDNKTAVSKYAYDTNSNATDISLAGVTEDEASTEDAKKQIDAENPANIGETFTLTTGVDTILGTDKNDTITGATGTLQDTDTIIDNSTTDNDTLNLTYKTAADMDAKARIANIENINVNIDAFAGLGNTAKDASFDATNVTGSTITLSSKKAGFDGKAGVLAAGANNVTAGSNVTDLNVTALTTGKVNTGTAKTVAVEVDDAKSKTANITVNGDVTSLVTSTVGAGTLKTVNITATDTAVLTTKATSNLFGAAATTTFNIDGDVTLKGAGAELTTLTAKNVGTGELKVEISDTATADLSKVEATEIIVADKYDGTLTLLEGASITAKGDLSAAAAGTGKLDIVNGAEFAAQTEGSELTIDLAGSAIGKSTITDFATTTINISQDTTVEAIAGNKTNLTGDMTIAFVGDGDVTFTGQTTAANLDASGINGDLTYATATGNKITVKGGTGANQITAADTAEVTYVGQNGGDTITANTTTGILSVETGSGKDTLNITALTTGKILANLGAGDDLVKIGNNAAALTPTGTLILDGGTGSDTLRIDNTNGANDLSKAAAGSSVTGFETLQLQNATGATNKVFKLGAYVLDGASMSVESYTGTVTAPAAADYDILVDESAAKKAVSVDLSGLTFSALKPITALDVKTAAGADTVIGANLSSGMTSKIQTGAGNDKVIVGSGAGVTKVNIEAGNNTIDLSNATAANVLHFDSTATGTTTINGWKAVTKLDFKGLGVTGVAAGVTESVTSADTNELVTDTVYFINTTGAAANFTLEGTAVVTDFTSVNQVSAYLNEHFKNTTSAVGDTNIFIFNDTNTGANKSYIYSFADTATNTGTVDAAELTLVGMVNNAGTALNTSNYVDGAFA